MTKKIHFSNAFVEISRINHPQGDYLELIWTPKTAEMDDEEYKTAVRAYSEAIAEEKLPGIYVDTTHFLYPIDPDLQDWINEEILSKAKKDGLRKTALRISSDFIAQLSVDQTMHEVPDPNFLVRSFDQKAEAVAWLQS